ncbi:MAG: hypothetical protein JWN36_2632 [Microbacteriaceae bacterium]|jgi:hypothetical protein|nr:hypothetical protein [Microbacteriaceae bacterium]
MTEPATPPKGPNTASPTPNDRRDPGDSYLQNEIDENRRHERWLVPKALLAIAVVAVLVIIRQVYFT